MSTNFSELSGVKQWAAVLAGGALVTAALYFTMFKSQSDKNATAQKAVQEKVRENNELESYRPKLKDMERQLANLKQQLEIERRLGQHDARANRSGVVQEGATCCHDYVPPGLRARACRQMACEWMSG